MRQPQNIAVASTFIPADANKESSSQKQRQEIKALTAAASAKEKVSWLVLDVDHG